MSDLSGIGPSTDDCRQPVCPRHGTPVVMGRPRRLHLHFRVEFVEADRSSASPQIGTSQAVQETPKQSANRTIARSCPDAATISRLARSD